jgi:hypothetical protein
MLASHASHTTPAGDVVANLTQLAGVDESSRILAPVTGPIEARPGASLQV